MPTVSVVIPTYNRADLIGEAIQSVLDQTFQDFAVHIIDDGSSDDTEEVVRAFNDQRLNYFWQENTGSPGAARNAGIARSRSEFIAFLDSDDVWLPDKLGNQVEAMRTNPACGIVFSNFRYMCEHDFPWMNGPAIQDTKIPTGRVFEALLHHNFIAVSTVMVRRVTLDRVGAFNSDPSIRGCDDVELWLRIAHDFEYAYVPQTGAIYRVHAGNMTQFGVAPDISARWTRVVEMTCERYQLPRKLRNSALSQRYGSQAWVCLRTGEDELFWQFIREGCRHRVTTKLIGLSLGRVLLGGRTLVRFYHFLRSRGMPHPSRYMK